MVYFQITFVPALEMTTINPETCRYKNDDLPKEYFKRFTRFKCFFFLFPKIKVDIGKENCLKLTESECNSWKNCAHNAEECCNLQKEKEMEEISRNETHLERNSCEHTWDGFSCWKRTEAGYKVTIKCPAYVSFPDDNGERKNYFMICFWFWIYISIPLWMDNIFQDIEQMFSTEWYICVLTQSLHHG